MATEDVVMFDVVVCRSTAVTELSIHKITNEQLD